jgi:dephospho-CoA kinase
MKTIGLVGGVASGKSLVAKMLVELGAGLLDADRTGHAVLADDAEVHRAIRNRWGTAVFSADGRVDRAAVARRVFAKTDTGREDREFLEALLHPRIRRRLESRRKDFAAENRPAVVLDAPLLLEAGWQAICDVVLLVDAPQPVRLGRARQRGWSEADFLDREAAQWSIERKRQMADATIENAGSEDDLRCAVLEFWQTFVVAYEWTTGTG